MQWTGGTMDQYFLECPPGLNAWISLSQDSEESIDVASVADGFI
jgi:hypothetical protein